MASNAALFGEDDSSSSEDDTKGTTTKTVLDDDDDDPSGAAAATSQMEEEKKRLTSTTSNADADSNNPDEDSSTNKMTANRMDMDPVEGNSAAPAPLASSSSDDDQDDTYQKKTTTTTTATTSTTNPPAPSQEGTTSTNTPKEQLDKKGDPESDDDSDDDGSRDAEFDDAGAVVGASSSKKKRTVASAEDNSTTTTTSSPPGKVVTDHRILVVPENHQVSRSPSPPPQLQMTKLPNLVGIQTQAFDVETYDAIQEEEDFGPAAYNLMRWRYTDKDTDNGTTTTESNTRLVQWNDGSLTLHVGTESFPVDVHHSADPVTGFPGINGYLYLSQQASYKDAADGIVTPAGTVLECVGPIHSRWTVRPSSLQSDAHQSLTVKIRQKTLKQARIAEFVTQEDPEKLKRERLRLQNDLDRAMMGRKQGVGGGLARGGGGLPASRRPRMSRGYLEADDDDGGEYDTTNLRDMKRRTMMGEKEDDDGLEDYDGLPRDDGDDDDDDEQVFRRVRPRGSQKPAKSKKEESEEEDLFMGDDDDDDEGFVAKANRKTQSGKKRSHQAVLDDEDDDDDDDSD